MAGISVVAKTHAKPGREADVEQALRAVVGPTHQAAGCLFYALHRGVDDPRVFVIIERWASREALDRHFVTPHIQALFAKVPELVAAPPEILVLEHLPEGIAAERRES